MRPCKCVWIYEDWKLVVFEKSLGSLKLILNFALHRAPHSVQTHCDRATRGKKLTDNKSYFITHNMPSSSRSKNATSNSSSQHLANKIDRYTFYKVQ